MASKGLTVGGIIASLALAAVTLTVFSASQLRGPAGSVHRFLMAVGERDGAAVDDITFGTEHQKLMAIGFVTQVMQYGPTYQVVDVKQDSHIAKVGVLLRFPDNSELPWVVSVRRVGRTWLIDTARSTSPGPVFLN